MNYKVGDRVRIIANYSNHNYMIGEITIITNINKCGYEGKVLEFPTYFSDLDCELYKPKLKDSIVKEVRKDLKDRSNVGIKKYGVTLDRKDLELLDWLQHSYEEVLDTALYLKRAIKELKTNKK